MKKVVIIGLAVGSILGGIGDAAAEWWNTGWSLNTGVEYLQ